MLLGFFFMLCFVAIVVIAIGTSIIRGILNGILGLLFGLFGRPKQSADGSTGHSQRSGQQGQSQSQQTTSSGGKKRDKIFDKSDGEYVDFEEIKE